MVYLKKCTNIMPPIVCVFVLIFWSTAEGSGRIEMLLLFPYNLKYFNLRNGIPAWASVLLLHFLSQNSFFRKFWSGYFIAICTIATLLSFANKLIYFFVVWSLIMKKTQNSIFLEDYQIHKCTYLMILKTTEDIVIG